MAATHQDAKEKGSNELFRLNSVLTEEDVGDLMINVF